MDENSTIFLNYDNRENTSPRLYDLTLMDNEFEMVSRQLEKVTFEIDKKIVTGLINMAKGLC